MPGDRRTRAVGGGPGRHTLVLRSARGRWVIAATVLGSGMAMLDSTVVGIALPSINRSFHGGVGSLQWVVTGYLLTLAAFLLLARLARGPIRPTSHLPDRDDLVRAGLRRLWRGARYRSARRRPRRPRCGRRPHGPGEPGHHPGLVPTPRTERGPSEPGQGSGESPRPPGPSSAATSSPWPRGDGSSSSICRWRPPWWR